MENDDAAVIAATVTPGQLGVDLSRLSDHLSDEQIEVIDVLIGALIAGNPYAQAALTLAKAMLHAGTCEECAGAAGATGSRPG